jgi:hypothetical protein
MRTRDDLIRDTEPFPDSLIQQVPPRGDDYVPWYEYAQRVLLHHPDHSYRVTDVQHAGDTWAVTVEFTIGDGVYGGIGEDSTPTSAESNAYKRALAHAGIGLHLYNRDGYWLHGRILTDKTENERPFEKAKP